MHDPEAVNVVCLAGTGHPVAEDSGGIGGWEDLKELFAKPRKRDEDDRKGLYKTTCLNGDVSGLDAHKWSILDVNDKLAEAFSPGVLP